LLHLQYFFLAVYFSYCGIHDWFWGIPSYLFLRFLKFIAEFSLIYFCILYNLLLHSQNVLLHSIILIAALLLYNLLSHSLRLIAEFSIICLLLHSLLCITAFTIIYYCILYCFLLLHSLSVLLLHFSLCNSEFSMIFCCISIIIHTIIFLVERLKF